MNFRPEMKLLSALLISAMLSLPLFAQLKSHSSPMTLALTNITIIDATGMPAQPEMTVVITDDRITALGKAGKTRIPKGAQIVDGSGKFLIPGMWDMHMHLSSASEYALPLLIANGVTGICDMGGDPDQIDRWRQEINSGARSGPRIVRAGLIVDGPRPEEGKFRVIVSNAAEGRQAVQSLKQRGADFIKVYHFLSREAYFAIADEARRQNIPFAGHIPNGVSPIEAADAGQRSIEHAALIVQSLLMLASDKTKTQRELTLEVLETLTGSEGTRLFEHLAAKGTWLTPTLVVAHSFFLRAELATQPDFRRNYIAAITREHWDKYNAVPQNVSAAYLEERRDLLRKFIAIVQTAHRAGVRMLAGTDPPTRDIFPGFSMHDELGMLVEAGLSPLEALQAATRNPAQCLGLLNSLGTIERGKLADLIILEANPLTDIRHTQKIAAVIARGKLHSRPALRKMLDDVEAAVKRKQ